MKALAPLFSSSKQEKEAELLAEKEDAEEEEEKKKIVPEPESKAEEPKIALNDALVFIQCESTAYLIEKALGEGEKMLVRVGSIVGISTSVYVHIENDWLQTGIVQLTGPGEFGRGKPRRRLRLH